MQKTISKVIATMLVAILVGFNCITTGVYAANIIEQNNETSEENITFDVKLGNEETHEGYEYTADIDSTDTNLYLNIGVKNTGYLKNILINLENNNYKFDYEKVNDNRIKNITENSIELNQINTSETVELAIPIIPNKDDKVSPNELGKDSTVKFKATYINEDNKEREIEKDMTVHINWMASDENLVGELSQEVIRYLNYDGKTMLSLLLSDGLKDSKLPLSSKQIQINVPTINDLKPSEVIVTAIDTLATNGEADGVNFTQDSYAYDSESGTLTINVENTVDENGMVSWVKGQADKFVVTYIYETNTNEEAITIYTETTTNTTLLNGTTVSTSMEQKDYNIDSKIGDIATVNVLPQTATLNKGYMYSNKDKNENQIETEFGVQYKLNVGLADALNEVTIKENGDFLGDINASAYIYDRKVTVSSEELVKVLGEEGKIDVLKSDGTVIGTLNKDTVELEINNSNISFVASKPQTEGEINLNVTKAIKGNLDYSKEQIASFKTLTSRVQINAEAKGEITLEEPTSKANVQISNNNLSTVVENENVVMNITLERDDVTDNLFANPELDIVFPQEITGIEIKDATLLYDEQLVSGDSVIDGNTIKLKFTGNQTEYSSQSMAKGTVIRLVLDLSLNNLSPSKQTNIVLSYTNDNDTIIANASNSGVSTLSENENTNTVEVPVNVVAPTGFVTTQSITGYNGDETVTAQESEAIGNLPVLDKEKTATISGVVVNNLGKDAEGLKVLGRIPFKGNKEVDGSSDLGTTFDTTLVGALSVEGIDATVYYSANGEATANLDDSNNGWQTEYTADAKSYMIVANSVVTNATTFNFNYNITIPANVDYANTAKASYGVYYNNDAQEGTSQNVVLASNVGVKTDDVPEINTSIQVTESYSGEEITNGGSINAGKYLNARITVKNSGDEEARNVKLKVNIPLDYSEIKQETINNSTYTYFENDGSEEFDLGNIAAGSEASAEINLFLGVGVMLNEDISLRAETTADNLEGTSVGVLELKATDGTLTLELGSNEENSKLSAGKEFTNSLAIKNSSDNEQRNVKITINLPSELEYVSGSDGLNYNSSNNTITYSKDSIEDWGTQKLEFTLKAKEVNEYEKTISMQATATFDTVTISEESGESVQSNTELSNTVNFYVGNIRADVRFTSNIEGSMLDTDTLEYYIETTNNSSNSVLVNISDILPEALYCREYTVQNGQNTNTVEKNTNSVGIEETVNPGDTLRLTIVARAYTLTTGSSVEIENLPAITVDGQNVQVSSIKHTINGTGIYNPDDEDDGHNTVDGTYRISGVAWIDSNKNGRKESTEQRLSGISVTLYDQNGYIVKDANGTEIKATTDDEGKYALANVPVGEYTAVAEYNTADYILTTYQLEGIPSSENSDFVEATLDGKPVAATNIIRITNSNMYNTDIGLQEREQFDLKLDKVVSRVTVTNTKLDPRTYEYNSNFAMVSLLNTYVEYATVLIEYNFTITNEGKVAGYAKELIDYMPEGMAFNSELNPNWYVGSDGNLYTTSLANTVIEPGETKTITLVLSRRMTGENTGTIVNTAEISQTYNDYGLQDGDSTPGNRQDGEDDISSATTLLAMNTGREVASFMGITLGVIAMIGLAVFLIKKYVIKRI